MTSYQIRLFLTTAKHKSFSKAADELGIVKQSLIYQLSQLEKELGCVFFTRTTQGIHLTEDGNKFLKFAKRISKSYESFKESIKKDDNVLKIAVLQQSKTLFLKELINECKDEYNITFEFIPCSNSELLQKLESGQIDCFLGHNRNHSKLISFEKLCYSKPVLLMGSKHHLIHKENIKLKELHNEKIYIGNLYLHMYKKDIESLKTNQLIFREEVDSDISAASLDVYSNNALAIVPELYASTFSNAVIKEIDMKESEFGIFYIHNSEQIQYFINKAKEIYKSK